MLGVTFGEKHSFHDMCLYLAKYPEITPPSPKIKTVDVPGADGALNLSRVLTGYMQYNRRTITMQFTIMKARALWPDVHSEIMDQLHGREMSVILDDDPEFCYTGTLSVSGFDPQKVTSGVTITMDAEPYKTKIQATRKTFHVAGSLTATITGSRKPVTPAITADSAIQMTYLDQTYDLDAGENVLPDVVIREGRNVFTFTGSGAITLTYREGRF